MMYSKCSEYSVLLGTANKALPLIETDSMQRVINKTHDSTHAPYDFSPIKPPRVASAHKQPRTRQQETRASCIFNVFLICFFFYF